ncbi:hypothetical protein GCM10009834_46710 [Streptomonospora arabica]
MPDGGEGLSHAREGRQEAHTGERGAGARPRLPRRPAGDLSGAAGRPPRLSRAPGAPPVRRSRVVARILLVRLVPWGRKDTVIPSQTGVETPGRYECDAAPSTSPGYHVG